MLEWMSEVTRGDRITNEYVCGGLNMVLIVEKTINIVYIQSLFLVV